MIDGRNFFDQPANNDLRTYDNIRKIATGQGDNCTTVCFLDFPYFKNFYKITRTDLSKQQVLDANQKAIQQINFIANTERDENITNVVPY